MIFLDPLSDEHQKLIKAINGSNLVEWEKKLLIDKIQSDLEEFKKRQNCKHSFGTYIGEKQCCMKCRGFGKNQGISWTLKSFIDEGEGEQTTHQE